MIEIVVVAAVAENGIIGRADALPWRLKSDMAHFRALTMGKPVVMGRKTYLSIGKPLSGRTTVVVSRGPGFGAPGVVTAQSLDAALAAARGDALRRGVDSIIIAGGADIYAQAMPQADALAVTHVRLRADGDVGFPIIEPGVWREISRIEHEAGPGDEAAFAFVSYRRSSPRDPGAPP